jgi:hypothetical protein
MSDIEGRPNEDLSDLDALRDPEEVEPQVDIMEIGAGNAEYQTAIETIDRVWGREAVLTAIPTESPFLEIPENVEFTVGGSGKGWVEDFCVATWGKDFNGLDNSKQRQMALSVWSMIAGQGISLNRGQHGAEWKMDFTQSPPSYNVKLANGDQLSGRLISLNRYQQEERIKASTRGTLGEVSGRTEEAMRHEDGDTVTPIDAVTEGGEGTIYALAGALKMPELQTPKGRTAYLEANDIFSDATIAGINKYMQKMVEDGEMTQRQYDRNEIEVTGAGYRGSADQHTAWLRFIRYDQFDKVDTPEARRKQKIEAASRDLASTVENRFERDALVILVGLGEDQREYVDIDVDVRNATFEDGEWSYTLGYKITITDQTDASRTATINDSVSYTGVTISEDGAAVGLGTTVNEIPLDVPAFLKKILVEGVEGRFGTGPAIKNYVEDAQARDKENGYPPEEVGARESGEKEQFGVEERAQIEADMNEFFDDLEASGLDVKRESLEITWGKKGKGREKSRYVEVSYAMRYGGKDAILPYQTEFVVALIPMKPLSTWRNQWDEMKVAFDEALEAKKEETRSVSSESLTRSSDRIMDRIEQEEKQEEIDAIWETESVAFLETIEAGWKTAFEKAYGEGSAEGFEFNIDVTRTPEIEESPNGMVTDTGTVYTISYDGDELMRMPHSMQMSLDTPIDGVYMGKSILSSVGYSDNGPVESKVASLKEAPEEEETIELGLAIADAMNYLGAIQKIFSTRSEAKGAYDTALVKVLRQLEESHGITGAAIEHGNHAILGAAATLPDLVTFQQGGKKRVIRVELSEPTPYDSVNKNYTPQSVQFKMNWDTGGKLENPYRSPSMDLTKMDPNEALAVGVLGMVGEQREKA